MFRRIPTRKFHLLLIAVLALASMAVAVDVRAQDDEIGAAQASPGTEAQTAVGWLRVAAVTCEVAEATPSVSLYLATEFVPDETCYDGYAGIWIDGIDYGAAAPVLETELDVGTYMVTEPVSEVSRAVDVYDSTLTILYAVTIAPTETVETEAVEASAETTALSMRMHVCDPAIQDTDSLLALGGRYARLAECPVLTLPDYYAPDGSTTAGQAWFDVSITDGAEYSAAISGGAFVSSAVCESELGVQLSTDPYDNACFSTSSYDLSAPATVLTLSMTALPDLHRFAYAEVGDDTSGGSVWVDDQASGVFGADLSAVAGPMVIDVYLIAPPMLTIVQHVCGPEIATAEALDGLGGFLARTNACPAVDRSGFDFDATVADGWGAEHYLSNYGPVAGQFCEADLGFDFNGVGNDNACLAMPAYEINNVGRGAVEVYPVFGNDGYVLGGIDFTPGTNDGSTYLGIDRETGQIALDTSFDGNVVLHIYAIAAAAEAPEEPTATPTVTPTATATATSTPGASATATATPTQPVTNTQTTGTVQVIALYCLGSQNQTTLTALAPGQQASLGEIGGTCFGGDARIQIVYAGEDPKPHFTLGRDGVEWLENAPVTSAAGPHRVTDVTSGQSATFTIQSGVVTRLVLRVEAALGVTTGASTGTSGTSGTTAEGSQPGATTGTGVNPLDLIGMLVTDVLVTDTLNYADGGENMAGSYDSNSFTVDLLGGLAVDELTSVTADGLPTVGNGERASPPQTTPAVLLIALAVGILGLGIRARRQSHGVSLH